jgi:hypothetical protein
MTLDLQKLKELLCELELASHDYGYQLAVLANTGETRKRRTQAYESILAEFTALIAELEKAQKDATDMLSLLPGVYYMDPPDGGDVRPNNSDAWRKTPNAIGIFEIGTVGQSISLEMVAMARLQNGQSL